MNFNSIKEWTITEGTVKQVADSLGNIIWKRQGSHDYSRDYFFVEDISGSSNTLSITGVVSIPITVYKSTDQINWVSMGQTSTTPIRATVPANGKLYLKATTNAWASSAFYTYMECSDSFNAGGNIMSLLFGDNFLNSNMVDGVNDYAFKELFYTSNINTMKLVSAENLILSATTLANGCYFAMFESNHNLTTPPVINATTLANSCYRYMFDGCTALTIAPALSATTLASACYYGMFYGCTSLTTAPVLSATTLATECYYQMFNGCTSLTTAPALPATTLVDGCYKFMFFGCTSLNEVTTYATDISATDCLKNWLYNVAATGDFYNEGGATYTSGVNGIPTGWTEHNTL